MVGAERVEDGLEVRRRSRIGQQELRAHVGEGLGLADGGAAGAPHKAADVAGWARLGGSVAF
jgi:hypothetical protein